MIAYNTTWLDALLTKETARKWYGKGLLSEEKWQMIQEKNPSDFYTPNVFLRIGLAIFTLILLIAAGGFIGMVLEPSSEIGFSLFCLFCGGVCMVVLERRIIQQGRHLKSGMDDMLLYVAIGAILTGLCSFLDYSTPLWVYYSIAWPILLIGTLRYLDRLVGMAAFFCTLGIVLLMVKDIPDLAIYLLPFAGMLVSGVILVLARQGLRRYAWRHWHGILQILELLSLGTFYASGNFWVIQEVGVDFFQMETIAMASFFWAFTFLVPFGYIFVGMRSKDRAMLDIGLGCLAAAVFSFRYYYHVMPLAWAAVIGGGVLFLTAFFSIRYLHQAKGGYVYDEDAETSLLQEIEQQLIEQTIVNQPGPEPDKSASFGGGQFGGGGSGGDF